MSILAEYLMSHNEMIDPISYYNRVWKDYHMQYHSHNRLEIMYVKRGKCKICTLEKSGKMDDREIVIIRPNVPHLIDVDEGCQIFNIEFGFHSTRGLLRTEDLNYMPKGKLTMSKDPYEIYHDTDDIESVFSGMLCELLKNERRGDMAAQYFKLFLMKLLYLAESESDLVQSGEYVSKIIEYINTYYNQAFTMDDLAEHLHLSKVYLHRIFRQKTGTSIVKYTNSVRMNKAKELLWTSDMLINDICDKVGINSRQYFTSMFKSSEGCTPFEYKNALKNVYKFDDRVNEDINY